MAGTSANLDVSCMPGCEFEELISIQGDVNPLPSNVLELIVVDASMDDELEIIANIAGSRDCDQFEVVGLTSGVDGVDEITAILASRRNLSAVHLITSGCDDTIPLGSVQLCIDSLYGYASDVVGWNDAMIPDAEFVVYGCGLSSMEGYELIEMLSALASVQVTAENAGDSVGSYNRQSRQSR